MTTKSPMQELLGDTLLIEKSKSTSTKDLFSKQKVELVGLYFSASWCPPCRSFSPLLQDFYNKINSTAGKSATPMAIVYVSSDKTVPEFEEYYGKMPWWAIPTNAVEIKNNLAQKLYITGIPALVILDAKTGNLVSMQARDEVSGATKDPQALFESWKKVQAVPLTVENVQAANKGNKGVIGILSTMLSTFLRNPMMLFAMLYFYRTVMRMYRAKFAPVDQAGPDDLAVEVDTNQDEF